jgi:uncharacterized protein involved in exopolysaccharide biosynthesis
MPDRESDLRAAPNLDGPPAGYFLVVPPADKEDENDAINLARVAALLRASWKLLTCLTLIGGSIAGGIALSMRNVYRAQAMIAPTSENQGGTGGSLQSEFGGIAAMAGINLGGGGGRKVEAMGTLVSPGFIRDFIVQNDLMPILFAERWDANAKTWRKGATPPTLELGIKRFKGRRTLDENVKTGLVTVSFDWYSPELAAKWTNDMIVMVNERMRARDILTAEKSLDYLNQEMATANAVELRLAISKLMETQENNKMVAHVQREYAYHFIDVAVPPQTKVAPLRSLMAAGGAILGLTLGVAFVLVRRRAASQSPSR